MRKLLISLAVAGATLAAVPAAAQYRDNGRHWDHRDDRHVDYRAVQNLVRELAQVEQRIDRSSQRGIISRREALSLRREANQIRIRLNRSGRNGLSGREFASLRVQVNRLEQRVRIERRDLDGRRG
jgi:hypothetical protein